VAIHFKGSGFHNTDYGKKKTGAAGSSEGAKDSSGDSKPSSDSKSDTKAAASTAGD
jgi:predicted nucleic acid-binding Zn ribbon protein